jgi:hypothetical protein
MGVSLFRTIEDKIADGIANHPQVLLYACAATAVLVAPVMAAAATGDVNSLVQAFQHVGSALTAAPSHIGSALVQAFQHAGSVLMADPSQTHPVATGAQNLGDFSGYNENARFPTNTLEILGRGTSDSPVLKGLYPTGNLGMFGDNTGYPTTPGYTQENATHSMVNFFSYPFLGTQLDQNVINAGGMPSYKLLTMNP